MKGTDICQVWGEGKEGLGGGGGGWEGGTMRLLLTMECIISTVQWMIDTRTRA